MRLQAIITVLFVVSAGMYGMAQQQPKLSVQRFEYISDDVLGKQQHWLNNSEAVWIKDSIRKSFSEAIYQRWNVSMPETALSSRQLGFFSAEPKFNTRLKDKQPGTWYMYIQVFNERPSTFTYNDTTTNLAANLRLRCRIINGDNDSMVHDKDLSVEILSEPIPPGEVALTKLQAHPVQFVQVFDSIATWLFETGAEITRSILLKPACALSEPVFNGQSLSQLEFVSDDTSIHLVTEPLFSFKISEPEYRRLTKKKNIGGNTATGVLTLLTGVDFGKSKVNNYRADFPFVTGSDSLHCIINYWQMETAERERTKEKDAYGNTSYSLESADYTIAQRGTDSTYINTILSGTDTIARFSITYIASNEWRYYTRLWDGSDSTTILSFPKEWNNSMGTPNVSLKGIVEGNAFIMQSSRERAIKNFFINDQIVLSVYGKTLPVKALQFQPLSSMQIKLFTILSSLPYAYFNYSAY